jgi:hypothetical protein
MVWAATAQHFIGGESQLAHRQPQVWYFSLAMERCRYFVSVDASLSSKRNWS